MPPTRAARAGRRTLGRRARKDAAVVGDHGRTRSSPARLGAGPNGACGVSDREFASYGLAQAPANGLTYVVKKHRKSLKCRTVHPTTNSTTIHTDELPVLLESGGPRSRRATCVARGGRRRHGRAHRPLSGDGRPRSGEARELKSDLAQRRRRRSPTLEHGQSRSRLARAGATSSATSPRRTSRWASSTRRSRALRAALDGRTGASSGDLTRGHRRPRRALLAARDRSDAAHRRRAHAGGHAKALAAPSAKRQAALDEIATPARRARGSRPRRPVCR